MPGSQLTDLLSLGGFHLTKWVSNSEELMSIIPEKEKAISVVNIDSYQPLIERTLGVQWNTKSDEFTVKVMKHDKPSTRRGVLSIISSIYDPMFPCALNHKLHI